MKWPSVRVAAVAAWEANEAGCHIWGAGTTAMPTSMPPGRCFAASSHQRMQRWNESGIVRFGVQTLSKPTSAAIPPSGTIWSNASFSWLPRPIPIFNETLGASSALLGTRRAHSSPGRQRGLHTFLEERDVGAEGDDLKPHRLQF